MEVLQESEVAQEEMTMELALTLGQGIVTLLNTTSHINGKLLYALGKNEQALQRYAEKFREKQNDLLKKHAELDEKGNVKYKEQEDLVPNGNPFLFKDQDSEELYEAEANLMLSETIEDFPKLHKVERSMFDALTINPQHNRSFPTIVDYLSL